MCIVNNEDNQGGICPDVGDWSSRARYVRRSRSRKGPETPSGVYARVVEGRTLYVNTTGEEKAIPIRGRKRGIISGTPYDGAIRLKPYDVDLVE